jgi:ABC-type multidrug transport system ATPase subunit
LVSLGAISNANHANLFLLLPRLRHLIGFIPQHDTILPDFTVRENILYSGRVLLGGKLPDDKIREFVDFVISSLGLETICDQLVGGLQEEGGRGISGGEYKRVSIALALVAAPKALILDEPTSGLDSTAAHSLMKLLHSLSRRGIMVICVIHQPRVEIFHLLDDILVLNDGSQVYLGKAAEAQSFFERSGPKFPIASNPADVILDILTNYPQAQDTEEVSLVSQETNPSLGIEGSQSPTVLIDIVKQRRASWPRELWLAFARSIVQQTRQTTSLALEIVSSAVIGLMIGLAAFESRGHFFQGIYHQPFDLLSSAVDYRLVAEQGLLCCLAIGRAFAFFVYHELFWLIGRFHTACAAGPPGVKIFGEEKLTFWRESQSGHSQSAYFLGKNLAVCFRMVVSSLHFTTFYLVLAAPMIPFHTQLGLSFLYFYCTLTRSPSV